MKYLLAAGCPVDQRDHKKQTPLVYAVIKFGSEMAEISRHPVPDLSRKQVIGIHRNETVTLLLEHGADPSLLDIYGRNCYDWIKASRRKDELDLCLPEPSVTPREEAVNEARKKGTVSTVQQILEISKCESEPSQTTNKTVLHLYNKLGRVLLLQGNHHDACTALLSRVQRTR